MSWDPGLANNSSELFDAERVEVRLPDEVTFDSFGQHVIDNLDRYGIWNYSGTHTCKLESDTVITGGRLRAGDPPVANDPLLGLPVGLIGKLVDLDPAAVWNSQIFFDTITVGGRGLGLSGERVQRLDSRWINFRRALDSLPIAGAAGAVWQTAIPLARIRFEGADQSPLLAALQAAAGDSGAAGITIRFATYRTLYFQNGIHNQLPQRPRNPSELRALYQSGAIFSNPAYSSVIGTIGVQKHGEPAGWPGGRFLAPVGTPAVPMGPAAAEVDPASGTLSLDFLHTIPERNNNLDKADVGTLVVSVRSGASVVELARLAPDDYARAAYLANAGVIDLPLPASISADTLRTGQLLIFSASNPSVTLLAEKPLVAFAEERSVYAQQGTPRNANIRVLDRGTPPARSIRLLVSRYLDLELVPGDDSIVPVNADGIATVPLAVDELGPLDYGLLPHYEGDVAPTPPARLDITAGFFASARVLPADAELDRIPDEDLTFELIFEKVLRTWHLLNPVMTGPNVDSPLSDEATMVALAPQILAVTDRKSFESFAHMPVTRDMSEGKLRLLHRWCARQARPVG